MIAAAVGGERHGLALRVSALFAAIFFVTGSQLPYLPVWLGWVGLSPREIAIICACPAFVRVLVMPTLAFAADRSGDHRRFLIGLSWVVLASQLLLAQLRSFWPILFTSLLFALAWTSIMPLAETIAIKGMRAVGLDYGRMRLWGSISFTAAALSGGWLVAHAEPQSVFWLLIAGSTLLAIAAQTLPAPAAAAGRGGIARLNLRDLAPLLGSPSFLVFLLAAGSIQAAHAAFYTFGTLHWRALGLSTLVAGLLWTVGVAAEILVFAISAAAIRRAGPVPILALAAAVAIVRWGAMAFDPAVWLLFALQTLHGVTFAAAHVGAIHFMARTVPEAQSGSAQALYAAISSGILLGGATLLAGPLYADYGARAYLAMAALAAVALLAALGLWQMPQTGAAGVGAQGHKL
jgi:MFS transporter, PPP family, 3-phenylpropionic acid transporter